MLNDGICPTNCSQSAKKKKKVTYTFTKKNVVNFRNIQLVTHC